MVINATFHNISVISWWHTKDRTKTSKKKKTKQKKPTTSKTIKMSNADQNPRVNSCAREG